MIILTCQRGPDGINAEPFCITQFGGGHHHRHNTYIYIYLSARVISRGGEERGPDERYVIIPSVSGVPLRKKGPNMHNATSIYIDTTARIVYNI